MNCHECNREAKWLVIDQLPNEDLFLPLCDGCFQELKEMEGEMNLDFEYIPNVSLCDVLSMANEKWKYLNQKYSKILKEWEPKK